MIQSLETGFREPELTSTQQKPLELEGIRLLFHAALAIPFAVLFLARNHRITGGRKTLPSPFLNQSRTLVVNGWAHQKQVQLQQVMENDGTWGNKNPFSGRDVHMDVSENYGYPQIIHFNRVFHYKPSILGYRYFWKHPYIH